MSSKILQVMPGRPRPTFVPLFYSFAGWGLAHAWLALIHASPKVHLLATVPALALVALSTRRATADLSASENQTGVSSRGSRWSAARGALLLLSLGAALGFLVVNGSVFLLAMGALLLSFVPSAWLPFRTHHAGLSVFVAGIGFVSVVLPGFPKIDLLFLPLATWAFWLSACCPLLMGIEQTWRAGRAARTAAHLPGGLVRPASHDGRAA